MLDKDNISIHLREADSNTSCEQVISFNTKEKIIIRVNGIEVEAGNQAEIFFKQVPQEETSGTSKSIESIISNNSEETNIFPPELQENIRVKTEGTAEIVFKKNKLVVVKSGTIKGVTIYYEDKLLDLFTFIDAYDRKNVGIHNLFLLWREKPEIIEYILPNNHEYKRFYEKSLHGGWFTCFNNSLNLPKGILHKFISPHDKLTENVEIKGNLVNSTSITMFPEGKYKDLYLEAGTFRQKTFCGINQGGFLVKDEDFIISDKRASFKPLIINLRIANRAVSIPLNWSKLDDKGNPTEDFYGRQINSQYKKSI